MKIKIDWAWLKETPPGSTGVVPGLGMRYEHRPGSSHVVEHIAILNGNSELRVQRAPRNKSGWSAPYEVIRG